MTNKVYFMLISFITFTTYQSNSNKKALIRLGGSHQTKSAYKNV